MKAFTPVRPIRRSQGLSQAARDLAFDIGPSGQVSHQGSDYSTMADRMERYGKWESIIAENISFTEKTGKDIVLQFIVDDGNFGRGHRNNILSRE
jgi:uncharacterized protein YkwD